MGIRQIDTKRWRVYARLRVNGSIRHKQVTFDGSKEEAKRKFEDLKAEIRGTSSLTTKQPAYSTFGDYTRYFLEKNGHSGMQSTFDVLMRHLADVEISQIADRFDKFLTYLKDSLAPNTGRQRTPSTINRYKACAKMALNYAVRKQNVTGLKENPLANFDLVSEEGRDRVLSADEQLRLFNTMERMGSYLYWPVYFSNQNPIRRGDLLKLTRENLDWSKPWVHFYPAKTRSRKPRETCLPFIDEALMDYFKSLPTDCPYLFPKLYDNGKWEPMSDFRTHWETVLRNAGIKDFHWHDLKHNAITWILDNGYAERDLKSLGIQYDNKMIFRYYHKDANKVLEVWKKSRCVSERVSEKAVLV
jgi:integrase